MKPLFNQSSWSIGLHINNANQPLKLVVNDLVRFQINIHVNYLLSQVSYNEGQTTILVEMWEKMNEKFHLWNLQKGTIMKFVKIIYACLKLWGMFLVTIESERCHCLACCQQYMLLANVSLVIMLVPRQCATNQNAIISKLEANNTSNDLYNNQLMLPKKEKACWEPMYDLLSNKP